MTDYLTGADQKIPNWLIKLTFPVKVETAIKLGIKTLCLVSWALSQMTSSWACGFSL